MDLYKEITERIMTQMENGVIPWHKPWISGKAISHTTGKPYSLLNQLMLGKPGEYLTFNQCQQEGGKVKRGEKASMVVFWKWVEKEDEETGEKKEVPFLRHYNVFHIDQCEGLRPKYEITLPGTAEPDVAANEIIYDYLDRSGVVMKHESGDRAYYQPMTDTVVIPDRKQFAETAELYSTIFHELTHSTGHQNRLDRLSKTAFFGSEAYSKEELIAELSASALVSYCGLETSSSFRNNAAYIQNWLQALRNDKRLIVSASSKAEKAVGLILNS